MVIGTDWISATKTRNFMLDDPLLDWLNRWGEENGYTKDKINTKLDFSEFIMQKGIEFGKRIYRALKIEPVCDRQGFTNEKIMASVDKTRELLEDQTPIIAEGVLVNESNKTWGLPDLIVSSDWLRKNYPADAVEHLPPDFNGHIIGDIKFCSHEKYDKMNKVRDAQLWVYQRALAKLVPTLSFGFYLKRDPPPLSDTVAGIQGEIVPTDFTQEIVGKTDRALQWISRVRTEGNRYKPGDLPELFPNMKNDQDTPWHGAKKEIAIELDELTQLWYLGIKKRKRFHEHDIRTIREFAKRYQMDNETQQLMFKKQGSTSVSFAAILDANYYNPPVSFARNPTIEQGWVQPAQLEFFVDFETFSSVNDDFSHFPKKSGIPMIFMIGCGEIINGKWDFKVFVAEEESHDAEKRIIESFVEHVERRKTDSGAESMKLYHWHSHEPGELKKAADRHGCPTWNELPWFDLIKVVQKHPIGIQGAFSFSLKQVAPALKEMGEIETIWEEGELADGLAASVAAWNCYRQSKEESKSVRKLPQMQEIIDYNEVDCKVMWEILLWMRRQVGKNTS